MDRWTIELNEGSMPDGAIRLTLLQPGRPMSTTAMLLFAGFSVLLFSDFRDSQAMGMLICFMLATAVWADWF